MSKGAFNRNLYFQHKLEGVDSEWSASLITNKIEYERLPSGKYNFMIRTVDNLGNISEIVSYDFTVLKPWYLTFWAYVGYIIVFLLIAYIKTFKEYAIINIEFSTVTDYQNVLLFFR